MSTTRRALLGSALATPLLASLAGTAFGSPLEDSLGTISNGWVEIRWTPETQAQLDKCEATVEPVAPAELVRDQSGTAVRFPVRSAAGDPGLRNLSKARGTGSLDGGLVVRTPRGEFRVSKLDNALQGGLMSGKYVVNGLDVGMRSMFRCGLDEARLAVEPALPSQPLKLRLAGMPIHPTKELLEAFEVSFGEPMFTADTILAHVNAEGSYTPSTT